MTPILISIESFKARYKDPAKIFFTESIKSINEQIVSVTTLYAGKLIGNELVLNKAEIIGKASIVDDAAIADESKHDVFYALENLIASGGEDEAINTVVDLM